MTFDERMLPRLVPSKPMALVGRKHEALRTRAEHVDTLTDEHTALAQRMFATLLVQRGLALTACQVGVPIALTVTNTGVAYFNVQVAEHRDPVAGDARQWDHEACLSLPGKRYLVSRWPVAVLTAQTMDGVISSDELNGTLARIWQHEADHLAGRVLCDHYEPAR